MSYQDIQLRPQKSLISYLSWQMICLFLGLQHLVIRGTDPYGLPLNLTLFPQVLKGLGYTTRLVGKWHAGNFRKEYTPTFRGFDSHYGYWTSVIDYFNYTDAFEPDRLSGHDFRRDLKVEYPEIGSYATDLFTNESVKIICDHDPSKPLFLFLSHLAPHVGNPGARLQAPEEDIQRFSYIEDKDRRVYAGGSPSCVPKMDGMNVWETIQGNIPSPRNEILVNIDPVYNGATIRVGDWKLLFKARFIIQHDTSRKQTRDPRANPIFWNNTWTNWFDFLDETATTFPY
ncbi:Arylsulfatase B [Armadillidium vulgare]|nr:Arylsulfatase B [Armadillidium vulgare]